MENKLKMFEIATTKYNEIADMVEKIYDNSLQNISKNKVMKNTKVTLKVNGKTYSAKTNTKVVNKSLK